MTEERNGREVRMPSLETPRIAGVYHAALGSAMTSQADRATSDALREQVPDYRNFVHQNRAFVRRAVYEFMRMGIDQFIDFGCGQPGIGSVYELVRRHNPHASIVHVDIDPIVVETVKRVICTDSRSAVLHADLVHATSIFEHPAVQTLIELDRPVGMIAGAVFHSVPNTRHLTAALRAYFTFVPAGSALAASHASGDTLSPAQLKAALALLAEAGITVVSRSKDEFQSLLGPWRLTHDGVEPLHLWRPDPDTVNLGAIEPAVDSLGYGAIATKP